MSRQTRSVQAPSHRLARVAELVRHAAADVLSRGAVEVLSAKGHGVTISRVVMSPDLRLATLFVASIGAISPKALTDELEKNKKVLRTAVAQRVNLKFAPDLRFCIDETFEKTARVDALLNSSFVRRDLEGEPEPKPSNSEN